ncbi:MAG: DNA-formamidopyrimidine glycosylase family protein [Bacteroidia bacterium]
MPEGPSIVLLKEEVALFEGKKIIVVSGNSKIDKTQLLNKKVIAFKSWGKHFLICFNEFTVRIHLLMFGSYRISEKKETPARLSLTFKNGELNFYACSVKIIEGDINDVYDFTSDVMNDNWDAKAAKKKLMLIPETLICDALLNQNIFSGVGNIIKNEVLYRVKIHPKSKVGKIPPLRLNKLIKEVRNYSYDFLEWKRDFVLKKHWLAHTKKICLRCNLPIIKEYTGVFNRRSFFCNNCQLFYT